jgi:MFS family permease
MAPSASTSHGFGPVLNNRAFRNLWGAQALAQTAQHAIHFVLIVLIERLTGSTIHQGLVIFAFTLPAVLFAPITGIIIDRWPKKWVLVASNALRVVIVLSYLLVLSRYSGQPSALLLLALYTLTFVMSTVGQFFNPSEAATIPLLVGQDLLITANSLFNLTLALSQVTGRIILGPLAVKLIGVEPAFVLIAAMYLVAALLVNRLPRDEPAKQPAAAITGWQRARAELREGWNFVVKRPKVMVPMMHLTLIASLVMVLAMLAPGIASRVLHLAPEDAIVVFAPAGLGMLLAATLLGRWGYLLEKSRLSKIGLAAMAVGFAGFGWVAWRFQVTNLQLALDSSVISLPPAGAALVLATIFLSLYLGLAMSGVNIVSQTSLQERTTEQVRGRVFALQFMLNNLVGIPPMLAIGGLADLIGIPQMLLGIALVVLVVLGVTVWAESREGRRTPDVVSPDSHTPARVSTNGHKPGTRLSVPAAASGAAIGSGEPRSSSDQPE